MRNALSLGRPWGLLVRKYAQVREVHVGELREELQ